MKTETQQRKTVTTFVAREAMERHEYISCQAGDIPAGVRWTTPRRNQGQIVTVSYGGFGKGEMDEGDPYMSRQNASLPSGHKGREEFFRLVAKQ